VKNLLHCPKANAVAIAETNAARAKEVAERYKLARSYSDYRDLLDQPDIDAVVVAVPNHLHAQVAIDALQARKHVLVAPPLATSAKDATRVLETVRKVRRTLMVDHALRFERDVVAARAACERGDLGEIYHARGYWVRHAGIPRIGSWYTRRQESGGGSLMDLGAQVLDLCLHLMGEFEVTSVMAQTSARFGPRGRGEMDWGKSEIDPKRPFEVEDAAVAWLRLKSRRTLILESGWAAHVAPDQPERGVNLWGTEGGLALFPARVYRSSPLGYETVHLGSSSLPTVEDRFQHFVHCALEGRKPLVAPDESVKVQKVVEALYASATAGREVRLE
jgi:predicted dehydrogenase